MKQAMSIGQVIGRARWILVLGLVAAVACQAENRETNPPNTARPTSIPNATDTPAPEPTPTEEVLGGTVILWHAWDEPEIPYLLKITKDFKIIHPDVHFDVLYIPFEDLRSRYEGAAREGGGPTILFGPAEWGLSLYQAELIAELAGFVEQEWLESINPAALESSHKEGALISLPYAIRGVTMFRNKEIIPTAPESFEQLVIIAREATQGEKIGAMLERSFFYSTGHLFGIGGQLMDLEGWPAFNNDRGMAWLELLKKFEEAGPTSYMSDADLNLFKENRLGVMIDGTWNMAELSTAIGEQNLAIDPWPTYRDGRLSGFVQSRNLYINSNISPENGQASVEFMRFFLSLENQLALPSYGQIPARRDGELEDPLISQAIEALWEGKSYPAHPDMEIYSSVLESTLGSVFNHGYLPHEALRAAFDKINKVKIEAASANSP
jgi:maltose-binding protein MalE